MDKAQWDFFLKENGVHKSDNKTRFALAGLIHSQVCKVVKAEIKAIETESKQARADSELQQWIDNPMSEEERRKYLKAGMDKAIHDGADIKELEILMNKLGLGEEEDEPIQVVDFTDAVEQWEGLR